MNQAHFVHQHYRHTTIGTTLHDSLIEMVEEGTISNDLSNRIMHEFDRQFNNEIKIKLKNKFALKGQLQTYRYCDGVWILIMKTAEFKDMGETIRADNVKIIACEAPKQQKVRGGGDDYYE